MLEVAKKTFTANMTLEGSWGSLTVGRHESTMTLSANPTDPTFACIEWDIPALERTEEIGLWFENKSLTDYDGVCSLPLQAVVLLREQGYTVDKEFE